MRKMDKKMERILKNSDWIGGKEVQRELVRVRGWEMVCKPMWIHRAQYRADEAWGMESLTASTGLFKNLALESNLHWFPLLLRGLKKGENIILLALFLSEAEIYFSQSHTRKDLNRNGDCEWTLRFQFSGVHVPHRVPSCTSRWVHYTTRLCDLTSTFIVSTTFKMTTFYPKTLFRIFVIWSCFSSHTWF